MNIAVASRAVLLLAGAAVAFTVGIASARNDKDTARRHCMALAHMGAPTAAPPNLAIRRNQTVTFNRCMERAGFGPDHAR